MTTISRAATQLAELLRWIARGISSLAAGFWLLIFLDILACDRFVGVVCLNWEMALLAVLAFVSVLSVIIAWRLEDVGGLVMVLWGLTFTSIAYFTSRPQDIIPMRISGVPFLVAGSLFMIGWWLRQ